MKPRLTVFILCALFLFTPLVPSISAAENAPGIILAFNDERVNIAGMPAAWDKNVLYVPLRFFTDNASISHYYDGVSDTLTVYNSQHTLSFNLKKGFCTNQNLEVFDQKALYINGTFYVPPAFIASQMGLGYQYMTRGPIARVTDGFATLSADELFEKLKPSPPQFQPPTGETPAPHTKIIFLTFDGADGSQLDKIARILSANQIEATFFLTEAQLSESASLVRQLVLQGHTLGITVDPLELSGPAEVLSGANSANDTLQLLAKFRTRLFRTPESDWDLLSESHREALVAAGYRLHGQTVDTQPKIGLSGRAFAASVKNDVDAKSSKIITIRLPLSAAGTAKLPALLDALRGAGHAFRPLSETSAPINPANDGR